LSGNEWTYIDETVAGGFWSYQATTKCSTLARQAAFPECSLGLIGAKKPADLARRTTNVSGRNICVYSDVLAEFTHEGNAEFADFVVGLALRVEVCTSFAAANVY